MSQIKFVDKDGTFKIENPENYSGLYFPIAGEKGLKSSVTPNLGGDSKLEQNYFLLEPVSIENLHNNKSTRNFWCRFEDGRTWSVTGASASQEADKFTESQDESELEAGFMWQKLTRNSKKYGIQSVVTSYVTIEGDAEVSIVEITNKSDESIEFTPFGAYPVYGRSADNIRDHRHVTSLLHRTEVTEEGIIVTPVLSFDERGHQKNSTSYFVYGADSNGKLPTEYYPAVEEFIGEGGSFFNPEAVRTNKEGQKLGYTVDGKETVGAFKFDKVTLNKGDTVSFVILAGVVDNKDKIAEINEKYGDVKKASDALNSIKDYWKKKVNVAFSTGDDSTDNYMKWICFQPILRRIYGCSFLPHHDYGRGGRGWRDLWQDCLALLILEPDMVRKMIVSNYSGVRIDGTNATIIGSNQGEFIADRNNITRVWMDHAFWPFITTKLYIDQTGDMDVLFEKVTYFKDLQSRRGTADDNEWNISQGNWQKTVDNEIYHGSIIEHILLQNLCAFYDVGDHNHMRLRGADWNDALDMAAENGESVAFTSAYAGNFMDIAAMLRTMKEKCGFTRVEVLEEMKLLLSSGNDLYDSVSKKRELLDRYTESCEHNVSGKTVIVEIDDICENLEQKAAWMMENIRKNEWIQDKDGQGWFNGYYDNDKNRVESADGEYVKMMLTSQVFSIMSGTAEKEQIASICKSADAYLYDKAAGGYRLNTDFHEAKFNLGRMFGFAYGEKENGAVFSHMTVMYGNALYKQGFVKEGYKVLKTLLDAAKNFDNSKMYPGVPEYFDNAGRGLYSYLTGAASWYMLTMINEVFGVKGDCGDLVIRPALMPEQFSQNGVASLSLNFAGKGFDIYFYNSKKLMSGEKPLVMAKCDNTELEIFDGTSVRISKENLNKLSTNARHIIEVVIS